MKEALFYEKLNSKVRCELCYRECIIPEGKKGFCRVRKNIGGKLYSLVYGKACTYSINPIEKKPFYHFWPGSFAFSFSTVGCNFRCKHCQNADISQASPGETAEFDLTPAKIVQAAKASNCEGISYTFTEPTVFFEYCVDTGILAKKEGLTNNFVTNGYMKPEVVKKAKEFLDGIRVDLKGDQAHYQRMCGAIKLEHVLQCIKEIFRADIHLEIITLVIPGENDNKATVELLGNFLKSLSKEIPWHFTGFYPAYKMLDTPPTPIETLEKMHDWARDLGMRYVYLGNAPGHRYESTYCPECDELLIQRVGMGVTKVNLEGKRCPSCGTNIPIVGEAKVSRRW
jgi:pyruvate formate lyase activating enzyme